MPVCMRSAVRDLFELPGESVTIKTQDASAPISAEQIVSIGMLGSSEALSWSQREGGLHITTPAERSCDHAYAFKIVHRERENQTAMRMKTNI
ncbi:MAG: hypothetical protein GC204_06055 [Chloroflexi bacterium]|nr:hypothetical protein [Chloroflexota bacterium]